MRPSHLLWTLLGILSTCEAFPKPPASSSDSHSHTTSISTTSHSSKSSRHSTSSSHHIDSSSRSLKSSKTSDKSKDVPSTSHHASSSSSSRISKTSSTSSRETTKSRSTTDRAIKPSSSNQSEASHQTKNSATISDHRTSSSKDSVQKVSAKSSVSTSTSHRDASSSSSSSSLSGVSKSSESARVSSTRVTSTSLEKTTTLQHNDHTQTPPLLILPHKNDSPQNLTVLTALNPTKSSLRPTSLDGLAKVTPQTNKSGISTTQNATSSSSVTTLQRATVTQPTKFNNTANSTSLPTIYPTGLALQKSFENKTGTCSDGTFVDASCFSALNLSDYISKWWAANEAECNSRNAQFARCFYALETQYGPSDCAQINNDAACTQPVWRDFENTKNGIQNFYVAWNLWNTAGFFLDLWTAIGAAESSCQAGIAQVVSLLDPPQQKTKMEYVLDVLSFGLSLYAEGSVIMKALLRSAPQGYGLGGKIFQRGTVNGEYQDWTIIAANIGKCTDCFRATVAEELPLIQNNLTSFILWSEISGLSGYRVPLNGLAQNMTQALNTYAIARILDTQGVVISRAANTDVHELQTNGSQLNWDTGCGAGYDSFGVCDTFFWDGVDTYGLTDPVHFTKNYHDELEQMFTPRDNAPSLTTGRLLFTGSQNCYKSTGQNGGAPPLLDPLDPSHIICLSNAPVCTWDESGYGPFDSSCKNDPAPDAPLWGFGSGGCKGQPDSIFSIDVPRAYLGPGIYQDAKNIDELGADTFCDDVDF